MCPEKCDWNSLKESWMKQVLVWSHIRWICHMMCLKNKSLTQTWSPEKMLRKDRGGLESVRRDSLCFTFFSFIRANITEGTGMKSVLDFKEMVLWGLLQHLRVQLWYGKGTLTGYRLHSSHWLCFTYLSLILFSFWYVCVYKELHLYLLWNINIWKWNMWNVGYMDSRML